MNRGLRLRFAAIILPALAGLAGVAAATMWLESYGWSLFLVLPLVLPFFSAFILRRYEAVRMRESYWYAYLSIVMLGVMILFFAIDGLICLLMALPLAALLVLPGAWLGHVVAEKSSRKSSGTAALLALLVFPAFMGFEQLVPPEPELRRVTTSVQIKAEISQVWDEVIAFDQITKEPDGIFRMGIAYPIQARIEGTGVGAIRYCEFSTGPFVEPISVWEPPHRLEFKVAKNPLPMKEMSPYGPIEVPHLHGVFVSTRGRFLLREKDGMVVLEGTTWYSQKLAPAWYWQIFSDEIVHRIHLRVLEQIKESVEGQGRKAGL